MKRGLAQLRRGALRLAVLGVAAYGAVVGAVWFGQRSLICHPWSGRMAPPPELTAVTLPVQEGAVTAWHRPARFTRGLAGRGYGLLPASIRL